MSDVRSNDHRAREGAVVCFWEVEGEFARGYFLLPLSRPPPEGLPVVLGQPPPLLPPPLLPPFAPPFEPPLPPDPLPLDACPAMT